MTKDTEITEQDLQIMIQYAEDLGPEMYYFFMRHGVIVEVGKFPGGKAAMEYCRERYGKDAVACLTVGGQDALVEYEHVYAPANVPSETPQ